MKLLVLAPFVPWPSSDGGRLRVFHLLKGLAAHHEVDLLALDGSDSSLDHGVGHLRRLGIETEIVPHRRLRARAAVVAAIQNRSLYQALTTSRAYEHALQVRLRERQYDLVQCEYAYMAQYRSAREYAPWVLDEHNIEYRLSAALRAAQRGLWGRLYGVYARFEHGRRRREELEACQAVDRVLTVSDIEREFLLAAAPGIPVSVIPNGVDLDHYHADRPEPDAERAVFVGNMEYRPNADGVVWFCREILPLVRTRSPQFEFVIVGNAPRKVRGLGRLPGVSVVGPVEDPRPYVENANVVVAPLRAGGGTRLKILEAFAAGRAVVSTSIGAEGLGATRDRHLRIADDPGAFADSVLSLLRNPVERARLASEGRHLVEADFGWPKIVARLVRLYEELARAHRPAGDRS